MKTLLIIDANLGQARAYMAKTLLGAAARKAKLEIIDNPNDAEMAIVLGDSIPNDSALNGKNVWLGDISRAVAHPELFLSEAGIDYDLKVKDWTDDQAAKIREIIGAEFKVEGDLRSEVQLNIKRLMDIGCYRGVRHRIGLPVRGQSTKNNARTRKGRKKTVANKKKATK